MVLATNRKRTMYVRGSTVPFASTAILLVIVSAWRCTVRRRKVSLQLGLFEKNITHTIHFDTRLARFGNDAHDTMILMFFLLSRWEFEEILEPTLKGMGESVP